MNDDKRNDTAWAIATVFLFPFFLAFWIWEGIMHVVKGFLDSPLRQEKRMQQLNEELYLTTLIRVHPSLKAFSDAIAEQMPPVPEGIIDHLIAATTEIYVTEGYEIPEPPPVANSIEGARYRDTLAKARDTGPAVKAVVESFRNLLAVVPETEDGVEFEMTLADIVTGAMLESMILPFYRFEGYFTETRKQLDRNMHRMSGIPFTPDNYHSPKLVLPSKYKGAEPVRRYVEDTALEKLLAAPVPFSIPQGRRNEHAHIIGGSGAGKTQLIQHLLCHDLTTDAAIVVIDSQSDLINTIARLDLPKDPIIISPRDMPSLNIFDVPDRGKDEHTREQIANGVIDTYMYVFDGILGADLTAKQGVFFKLVARLLLNVSKTMGRNATVKDMFDLMDDITPYLPVIERLPDVSKSFFLKDFNTPTYKQTKEQIRYRLNAILENPTIARLFTSEKNSIDLYAELNRGSVILVDTAKDFLKSNSAHFGRFFISLVLRAILERAASRHRPPAYLYVDEAAEYFDKNIDEMLTTVRKYNLGCVFAHQFLDQCTPGLRSSLAANTAIKLASGVSTADARSLASDMRTTPEFILTQPKLHFACHVRGMKSTVAVKVDAGRMEREPKRDDYTEMLERNRQRVAAAKANASKAEQPPPPETTDDPTRPAAAETQGDW